MRKIKMIVILFWTVFCINQLGNFSVFADVLVTLEEALTQVLPSAETIEQKTVVLSAEQKRLIEQNAHIEFESQFDRKFQFYIGTSEGKIVGYAIPDTVHGKWGPIRYLLAVNPDGVVANVVVLEYQEKRGRPTAKKRFLRQYIGKGINDPIKLKKDIDGITGATISSRGITDGIRKLLYVFEELNKS